MNDGEWTPTREREWLENAAQTAKQFLMSHKWCTGLQDLRAECFVAPIFALFGAHVTMDSDRCEGVWVLIGDLPPAYLDRVTSPTARDAFENYLAELEAWVEAARKGLPINDIMPVCHANSAKPIPPTSENTDLVVRRISLIRELILPNFDEAGAWRGG